MDRSVTREIVYGPQLRFGPYNILWVTSRSINCHITLSAMNYLLNISKAFDKVWHRHLLKKIKAYIIYGNLSRWFENYLSDRNEWVVLQNCLTEVGNVKGGVPQRSVLGLLLFILYINAITDDMQSLSRSLADHYRIHLLI